MATWDQPAIVYGLRGMCSVNIDVVGPKLDVHSGVYGGGINNPINALVHILSQLIDADGHILIPGFYDDVLPLEAEERERINAFPFDEEAWLQRILVTESWGVPEYTTLERTGARPTLDVNGIIGGYTGDGARRRLFRARHTPRCRCGWYPIKIRTIFWKRLRNISRR
ncbi:MAG: peptidase dimerization domain-containing protein [Anaerolineae bacterium]|nr:peptidase dimerization domain-containing protein [Anaerolineae bacterium]